MSDTMKTISVLSKLPDGVFADRYSKDHYTVPQMAYGKGTDNAPTQYLLCLGCGGWVEGKPIILRSGAIKIGLCPHCGYAIGVYEFN